MKVFFDFLKHFLVEADFFFSFYDPRNKWTCITLDVSAHNFALLVHFVSDGTSNGVGKKNVRKYSLTL